jgi:hypothetical protein
MRFFVPFDACQSRRALPGVADVRAIPLRRSRALVRSDPPM